MLDYIALDLEGTLISTAVSQFPRPGLHKFMQACEAYAKRTVIYSAAEPQLCRKILQLLVSENEMPGWAADMDIIKWPERQQHGRKDLRYVQKDWQHGVLVDDLEMYVHPVQFECWLPITNFDGRNTMDNELERVAEQIRLLSVGARSE